MKAAILARVSDTRQGRSTSVLEQLKAGRQAISDHGWDAAGDYVDSGLSASRYATKARPEWERLQRDLPSLDVIVCWEPSRGSREMADWARFLNRCRGHCKLFVVSHGRLYDPANARDRRSLLEDGIDAEYESEKTSARVSRKAAEMRLAGLPYGLTPFGYLREYDPRTGRLVAQVVDPDRALVVAGVFRDLAAGVPGSQIARETGLSRSKVQWMARNVAYAGLRRLPDGTHVRAAWPPLVDEALFWRVQQLMDSHQGAGNRRPGAVKHLLSWIATCGKCGGWIRADKRRGMVVYRCNGPGCVVIRPHEVADNWVTIKLCDWLDQPGILERYWQAAEVPADAGDGQLRGRLADAAQSFAAGRIPIQALEAIEADLRPRLAAAEARARAAAVPQALRPFGDLGRYNQALKVWEEMTQAAQRDVLRAVCEVVMHPVAAPERVTVTFR